MASLPVMDRLLFEGNMDEVNAIIGILATALLALFVIAFIDALPPVEGHLAPTFERVKLEVAEIIALAVGGTVTIVILLIARLRSI